METVTVNVVVEKAVWAAAKASAGRRGRTMRSVVNEALRRWATGPTEDRTTAARRAARRKARQDGRAGSAVDQRRDAGRDDVGGGPVDPGDAAGAADPAGADGVAERNGVAAAHADLLGPGSVSDSQPSLTAVPDPDPELGF